MRLTWVFQGRELVRLDGMRAGRQRTPYQMTRACRSCLRQRWRTSNVTSAPFDLGPKKRVDGKPSVHSVCVGDRPPGLVHSAWWNAASPRVRQLVPLPRAQRTRDPGTHRDLSHYRVGVKRSSAWRRESVTRPNTCLPDCATHLTGPRSRKMHTQ